MVLDKAHHKLMNIMQIPTMKILITQVADCLEAWKVQQLV